MILIDFINKSIDPFLMQLMVVPFIAIGIGVLIGKLTKKVVIAPMITLILNIGYEKYFLGLSKIDLGIDSWNIIFTLLSFTISLIVIRGYKLK